MEKIGIESNEKEKYLKEMAKYSDNLGIKSAELKGEILDLGAGDGEFDEFLAQNKEVRVTAIDEKPPEDAKFGIIKAEAKNLPFKNESYDVVISHASIPNVFISLYSFEHPEHSYQEISNAIEKVFREIIRVLKKEGKAYLAPVRFAENYDSEKKFKKATLENIQKLKKEGHEVFLEFIRTETNPENKEKSDSYRMKIIKNGK